MIGRIKNGQVERFDGGLGEQELDAIERVGDITKIATIGDGTASDAISVMNKNLNQITLEGEDINKIYLIEEGISDVPYYYVGLREDSKYTI